MEIGERQAKGNEKNLCLKEWETLVTHVFLPIHFIIHFPLFLVTKIAKGKESIPAFMLNLKKHIDNQMIIATIPDLEHYRSIIFQVFFFLHFQVPREIHPT